MVLVEEGEFVIKGQVLVHFNAAGNLSLKAELESAQAAKIMKLERLDAYINLREPDFSKYVKKYPELVLHNQHAFLHLKEELAAAKQSSISEMSKTRSEYQSLEHIIPSLKKQVKGAKNTVAMMRKLLKTGAISKVKYLEEVQKLNAHIRELEEMKGRKQVLKETLHYEEDVFHEKYLVMVKTISDLVVDVQAELLSINARLAGSVSTVSQDTIKSPVAGVVQSIPSTTSGSVIQPGGTVAVIVPTTKTALLEAKISPRDIGFIALGDQARVKIDAFDYSRYGALNGIVHKISPTTDADQKGGVFYKVQISIGKPYFGSDPEKLNLIPGMTGEADIVTGEKTVFQYLWKPVFTNISNAFGER